MQIIDTQAASVSNVTIIVPSGVFPLHEELDPLVHLDLLTAELKRHYGDRFVLKDVNAESSPPAQPDSEAAAVVAPTPKRQTKRRGA